MKKIIVATVALFFASFIYAAEPNKQVFELLDLNRDGLCKVKSYYSEGNFEKASEALLDYYKKRTTVNHPDIDIRKIKLSKTDKKYANEGLEHKFFVHKGYQPSYFYGKDIDWEYWPVKDNELRWQLHRHKWWAPMGRAYQVTGDEKYAKEWVQQYMDWIEKNPLIDKEKTHLTKADKKAIKNMRFAWRPLEVSHRIQDQTGQFLYFISSKYFTAEFLAEFLINYHKHAEHILHNYSERGNHLLFEAQRMIYAGAFFSEFKQAEQWRKSGINVLNKEIKKQVYPDGMQYELDPHYHLASVNIFYKALQMADVNGFRDEFPDYYLKTVENMVDIIYNISFPDYTMPCFGDAKAVGKNEMLKNYKRWQPIFPLNEPLKYFATDGKKGSLPNYLSRAFKESGYYVLRNGWKDNATVMVFKAGPPAFWHNQPDNGTFELYIKGRNFFPDAGSYVYAGSNKVMKERNWFRQTMVHKTLTLNNENIEQTDSKLLLWDVSDKNNQKLIVENQSYKNLKHRRAVFFVNETFFVIVDEAIGDANGKVGVHYQLSEGDVEYDYKKQLAKTNNTDNNNVMVQAFGNQKLDVIEEEGWVSYSYRQKNKRPAFVFQTDKNSIEPVRFITVIYPITKKTHKISAKLTQNNSEKSEIAVQVKIDKKKYNLNATW